MSGIEGPRCENEACRATVDMEIPLNFNIGIIILTFLFHHYSFLSDRKESVKN